MDQSVKALSDKLSDEKIDHWNNRSWFSEQWDNFTYFFRRKSRQIKNVFKWLPVIWNQYDYDAQAANKVFMFQLAKTADFLESPYAMSMSAKHDASRIRMVLRLMEKVNEEDYALEFADVIEKKYGKSNFDFIPVEGTDHFEMVIVYEKEYSPEQIEEIENEKYRLIMEGHKKQDRAHKLMWDLIEHNIRGWWD